MQKKTQQFEFHGTAGEFFKIWIVNIMLSIVTLGIYSAWAKVRNRQYFYSNTLLMNTSFDYLANPVKILKGRLLVLAIFFIYTFSSAISPALQGILMLIFFPLLPWVIIRALKFNLINTAYRNIRFNFNAEYLKAAYVFLGLPIVIMMSLGLAYPFFARERKKFVIDHSAYGTSQFELSVTTGQFYGVYFKTFGVSILIIFLSGALYYLLQMFSSSLNSGIELILPAIMLMLFYPFLMIIYGYLYTTIANLVINHTRLKQCQFQSSLEAKKICWLYFSNTVAIIFSLGLLIPWAMIRTARYRISCISLITDSDLDAFIAAETDKVNAFGEEFGDFLDIDVGL